MILYVYQTLLSIRRTNMSYQEKRTIVMIVTGVMVLAAYCIYAFGQVQAGMVAAGDLKYWARTMLIFIGIGIAATIVIQIIFHILLSITTAISKKIQDPNFLRDGCCDRKQNVEDDLNDDGSRNPNPDKDEHRACPILQIARSNHPGLDLSEGIDTVCG